MRLNLLVLILVIFANSAIASVGPGPADNQIRRGQIVQMNMDLGRVRGELAQKKSNKADLEKQLAQVKDTAGIAKSFGLRSKLKKLDQNQASINNDLQQIAIEIKSLKDKEARLNLNLEKLKTTVK